MEGILFFSLFISAVIAFLLVSNKKNKNAQNNILNYFEQEVEFSVIGGKCTIEYFGLDNRSLNFKQCDLYAINDAFIIINNDLIQKTTPKILTNKLEKYQHLSNSAKICKLTETSYNNELLTFKFVYNAGQKVVMTIETKIDSGGKYFRKITGPNNW